jgi:hypothetical protein
MRIKHKRYGSISEVRTVCVISLIGMVWMLAVSSCSIDLDLGPHSEYFRSDTAGYEEIIGFYKDSEIVVQQQIKISDWYEYESDTYSKTRTISSVARSFNYMSSKYSEAIAVPEYPYMEIYGEKAYYRNDGYMYLIDFTKNTASKVNSYPISGAMGVSGNGNIVYTCDFKSMNIIINGKSTKIDSIAFSQGSCDGYTIISDEDSWVMINNIYNPIRYAKIGSNGIVSKLIDSNDSITGHFSVHNIGAIPYYSNGDSLYVPRLRQVCGCRS